MTKNKIIIFGAGKIGRSFIGQVFGNAGYELVFVDIYKNVIDLINAHKEYKVIIKSDVGDKTILVKNARGIHLVDTQLLVKELTDAPLASVSVGQQGLPGLIPVFARALLQRFEKYGKWPLDVIIAENMRNADVYFSEQLTNILPEGFPINSMIGLVETSIGKMVPLMNAADIEKDPLQVFAEPYNTLIVSRKGFKNPVPEIEHLSPKDNIKAWVDRKLFIHNLGHAAAAYLGFRKNNQFVYMYEALDDQEVFTATRNAMIQSADILLAMYPDDFTLNDLHDHVDDLIHRFRNRALGDTLFRVGCDLNRKLGPDDRFTAPIRGAIRYKMPYGFILNAMAAGVSFRATDEQQLHYPSDKKFFTEAEKGLLHVLKQVARFSDEEIKNIREVSGS